MIHPEQQLEMHPSTNILEGIELTSEGYVGQFQQYTLKSVFQPIFSFAHDSPIGFEALLRARDKNNQLISPIDLFSNIDSQNDLLQLEQLSRTIHILNFIREETNNELLFLNINPRLISNCNDCLKQLLELLNDNNIAPTRIVIEFIEESFIDTDSLIKASQYLRQSGCLIAIDDFGAGHSNFNRIWDLKPDIVKLDKSLIQRIREDSWYNRPITSLVELLHESNALVLIEGIEDQNDADWAHELNVDLHQGYFFGRPKPLPFSDSLVNPYLKNSNENDNSKTFQQNYYNLNENIHILFSQSAMALEAGIKIEKSCEGLLNYPYTILCYILNDKGYQLGNTVSGKYSMHAINHRYGKLSMSTDVNWSRRVYFQKALAKPMEIQSTRPYLSLTSGQLCITLSIAIKIKDKTHILCCDIKSG